MDLYCLVIRFYINGNEIDVSKSSSQSLADVSNFSRAKQNDFLGKEHFSSFDLEYKNSLREKLVEGFSRFPKDYFVAGISCECDDDIFNGMPVIAKNKTQRSRDDCNASGPSPWDTENEQK
ncbi:CLUMA_CG013773, isoform A [Clunio marinus]|uniref:CLUMA_CG013773, isoform A n=1 Tax=Clunio marinus TaxID=568069 RepID=A0A1J1IJZ6_9DIPT|nr:CLUMA_CG013773, isoform A [Clunio marinus]